MRAKKVNRVTPLFMFFGILFTACILISNIIAIKLITIGPWTLTAGVIVFPISYILSDIVAEVYGFKAARSIMWTAFAMNLLMVIMFEITIVLPAPVYFTLSGAVASVLGNTPRLLVAGLTAYVLGSYANAAVLSRMKVLSAARQGKKDIAINSNKGFGWRAIISTIVGETIDSCIFIPLAFIGSVPAAQIPSMIILQICVKTCYEIVVLPITRILVKWVKQYESIDTYDIGEKYHIVGE